MGCWFKSGQLRSKAMPTSPPRWCARCQHPHASGCPSKPQRVDNRPNATERGYDRLWQHIRAIKRARDPLCEWCRAEGRIRLADLVDHYIPLAAGGTHADENLVSMCRSCHGVKTEQDREKYPQVYRNRTVGR